MLELREPSGSPVTLSRPADHPQPRPIGLVSGHTYHISCQDESASESEISWRQNNISVQSGMVTSQSGVGVVYSSPDISSAPNEQTLVLQEFGPVGVGVFSCHGIQGDIVSLNISQSKFGRGREGEREGPCKENLTPFVLTKWQQVHTVGTQKSVAIES